MQAERQLLAIEAASVPHMTDSARGKVARRHQQTLQRTAKPMSLVAALATLPIPVVHVPKEVK